MLQVESRNGRNSKYSAVSEDVLIVLILVVFCLVAPQWEYQLILIENWMFIQEK